MTKGIAIILMVLVHARFSRYGDTFINMFHMPLFFFMSGYCFKDKYLGDFRTYLKKRIKGAYWPYVKWGLVFLLLHNVFYALNIYNGEYGFRGEVSVMYTWIDIIKRAFLIIFTMNGAEQLLGGYWFLHSYFIAAIISFFIIWLLIWLFPNRHGYLIVGGGLLLVACAVFLYLGLRIPYYVGGREILASAIMVFGYAYKKSCLHLENYPLIVIPLCFLIVIAGTFAWPCSMLSLTWRNTIPYAFSAISGTFMIFAFCEWIKTQSYIAKILTFVGDRTIVILTWHFLSYKFVSLLIILIYGMSFSHLSEFPVIESYAYKGWWILYLTIGVMIPLCIKYFFSNKHLNWQIKH